MKKTQQELFNEIADNVRRRLLKEDEQKLHIALLGDLISKNDENRDRVIKNYKMTIQNAGNLFGPASGIENDKYKYLMASFLCCCTGRHGYSAFTRRISSKRRNGH